MGPHKDSEIDWNNCTLYHHEQSFDVFSQNSLVLITQLCPTLYDPLDCSPPGSFVRGILPARILEQVAISPSSGSSRPRDWTLVSCLSCTAGGFATTEPHGKPLYTLKFSKSKHVPWVVQPLLCSCLPSETPCPHLGTAGADTVPGGSSTLSF